MEMANIKKDDEFLLHFNWLTDALKRELTDFFNVDSIEIKILSRLKSGWGKHDTVELLRYLSAEYGEKAGQTVEQFIKLNIFKDWPEIGKKNAKVNTEIEDFIRVLWEPLIGNGFEFSFKQENDVFVFNITKCPVFELAKKTNMRDWLYHMACSTDYYTAPAFSKKIGFTRSKTLMQNNEYCNHTYYYKKKSEDSLL
jgi:hypothetical protein